MTDAKAAAGLAAEKYAERFMMQFDHRKVAHDSFEAGVAYESPLAERRGYLRGLEEAARAAETEPCCYDGMKSICEIQNENVAVSIRALAERGAK